jgi:hypothetical protein
MEPAAVVLRFVLAFVFLAASLPKLLGSDDFRRAVRAYRLLPQSASAFVARWIPRLELLCALALLVGIAIPLVGAAAGTLLLIFAFAVAVNLARGREIDCGCYAKSSPRRITWTLVVRDCVLGAAAFLVALQASSTLALDAFWRGSSPDALRPNEGLALGALAMVVVLLDLLLGEAMRVHLAARRFMLHSTGEQGA